MYAGLGSIQYSEYVIAVADQEPIYMYNNKGSSKNYM